MNHRQEILDRLQELQQQIEEIRNYVLENSAESVSRSVRKEKKITIHDYRTFFTWQQKIIFILKYRNKSLLSSEIVSFMDDFDTVFEYKWTQLAKLKILSTHLNRAAKKGVIKRFKQDGVRGYYYSLPDTN